MSLFDAAGTLIAIGDDSALDPGSVSTLDSFLGVIILAPGTYRIAVTQFGNSPSGILTGTGGLTRPDGSPSGGQTVTATPGNSSFSSNGPQPVNSLAYTMNVSVENASPSVATPAPATILVGLFAAGFAGLARAVRRKVTA